MRAIPLLALLAVVSLEAQTPQGARDASRPPAVGTASISGVVTADEPGGRPVRRVVIAVNGSDATTGMRASLAAVTDDRGRFVLASLPAGRYTLTVTKGGWITEYYGSKRPGRGPGLPIALADAEQARADVKLTRGAVITGRIVDESGNPQAGVRPQLMEYRTISGQRRLMQANLGLNIGLIFSQTNDLGEYRLFGVPPGSYVVAASPGFQAASGSGARMTTPEEVRWALQQSGPAPAVGTQAAPPPQGPPVTYASVFYPGVSDPAAATMITVAAGEERSGVDLVMNLVATARIQGTVTRPDGQPARGAQLSLTPARMDFNAQMDAGMRPVVDAQGRFTFPSVRPGQYVVVARASSQPPPPPGPPSPGAAPARPVLDLWGLADVTVEGRDISGLSLALQPGLTVSGRVVFEATTLAQPANLVGTRIMFGSASMLDVAMTGNVSAAQMNSMFMGPIAADGTFTFAGVMPGQYILSANAPVPPGSPPGSSWMTKSVVTRGRDALQSGFEVKAGEDVTDIVITFTDRTSQISGTLVDAAGRPAPEYFVFVFPADKSAWTPLSQRLRPPMRPASDGKFRISPLPQGEYYMAALTDFEPENLYDAAFLEQVAAAAFKITLGEGEKKIQDLKIMRQ